MVPFATVREQRVFLADNEWGSELMYKVAGEILKADKGDDPLVVIVHEHAGWQLGFALIDGEVTIMSSANGSARFPQKVEEFRKAIYHAKWTGGPEIRRNDLVAV